MKIINLTNTEYPWLEKSFQEYNDKYSKRPWAAAAFSSDFRFLFNKRINFDDLINGVPVFLVNEKLSKSYVTIPGYKTKIYVPDDKPDRLVKKGFNINKWKKSKKNPKKEEEKEPEKKSKSSILGLYDRCKSCELFPRRIFIWVDKIQKHAKVYARNCLKEQPNCLIKVDVFANALFNFVLSHEQGHVFMDVELYGETPSPRFSYGNDYIYFFIEEAYANAYALTTTLRKLDQDSKDFIITFVKKQKDGYKKGRDWYEDGCYNYSQWMIIKSAKHFMSKIDLLVEFWKTKEFSVLSR